MRIADLSRFTLQSLLAERQRSLLTTLAIAVGIARAGAPDASVKADLLPRLQGYDLGGPLHILIIPARLHFMEAEALRILADAPADAVQCYGDVDTKR